MFIIENVLGMPGKMNFICKDCVQSRYSMYVHVNMFVN